MYSTNEQVLPYKNISWYRYGIIRTPTGEVSTGLLLPVTGPVYRVTGHVLDDTGYTDSQLHMRSE